MSHHRSAPMKHASGSEAVGVVSDISLVISITHKTRTLRENNGSGSVLLFRSCGKPLQRRDIFHPACAYHGHNAYSTCLALVFQILPSGLEVGYASTVHRFDGGGDLWPKW